MQDGLAGRSAHLDILVNLLEFEWTYSVIYGFIAPDDASFRAVCMLFAEHPQYADMPFRRVPEILRAVQSGHVFAAVDQQKLVGFYIWTRTSDDVARQAIDSRKLPHPSVCGRHGQALVATAFVAPSAAVGRRLSEAFVKANHGSVILYERHRLGKDSPPSLKWVDRAGRHMGTDI